MTNMYMVENIYPRRGGKKNEGKFIEEKLG